MDRTGYAIAILLALFGLTAGAVLVELLQHYPEGSWQKEWLVIALWLIAILCIVNIVLVLVPAFSDPEKHARRPKMEPITWINLGFCLIIFGVTRYFSETQTPIKTDNEYIYFDVDLLGGRNSKGELPGRIMNMAPSTFTNVIAWFSPEAGKGITEPQNETNLYWSLKHLQVFFPILHSGNPRTGKFLPIGYYFIQSNAVYKDISYYFRELLEIKEHNGSLIQLIDVWKTIPSEQKTTKVYTSDRPREFIDNRAPF